MKESIKTGLLLLLVVVFAIFFASTKGDDELNLDINIAPGQNEFSYEIYDSEYNGEYRNTKSNGAYVFVGKNSDGTYRIYFIQTINSIKNISLKLDNVQLENGKLVFKDSNGSGLNLVFGQNNLTVDAEMGSLGNERLEGFYTKVKDLEVFSMSEFEY